MMAPFLSRSESTQHTSRFQVRVLGGSLLNPLQMAGKDRGPGNSRGLFAATVHQPDLRYLAQSLVNGVCQAAVHTLDDVAVSVQRLRYRSVSQELLHVLRMDVAREQQGGTGVSEIVKPD